MVDQIADSQAILQPALAKEFRAQPSSISVPPPHRLNATELSDALAPGGGGIARKAVAPPLLPLYEAEYVPEPEPEPEQQRTASAATSPLAAQAAPSQPRGGGGAGASWKPADLLDPIWANAPRCAGRPDDRAQVTRDTVGRLWGWQKGISCAFKSRDNQPLVPSDPAVGDAYDRAPLCDGVATAPNSLSDSFGRLWGWQDGRSCSFRGKRKSSDEDPPNCSGYPTETNSVRDSWGRLWGWERGSSCHYA